MGLPSSSKPDVACLRVRRGDWIQTFTGRQFWPIDPRPEDVEIEDIAHALSLLCRFTGHVREFYSVAQHSVLVACLVEEQHPDLALAALLHDASEAYLVDVPRPIKPFLDGYRIIEQAVSHVIAERFNVNPLHLDDQVVKGADRVLLRTEQRDLMPPAHPGEDRDDVAPLRHRIYPMDSELAEVLFLRHFHRLAGQPPLRCAECGGDEGIEGRHPDGGWLCDSCEIPF